MDPTGRWRLIHVQDVSYGSVSGDNPAPNTYTTNTWWLLGPEGSYGPFSTGELACSCLLEKSGVNCRDLKPESTAPDPLGVSRASDDDCPK